MPNDPLPNPLSVPPSDSRSADTSEASTEATSYLTLKEAARAAAVSDSTLRRLVKGDEVPYLQEETKTGFRYLFELSIVNVIAHKAAMRRPSGRPAGRRVGGDNLQASSEEADQKASVEGDGMAALRVERDLLRAENARLWSQIDRLTDTVTQLALPPSRVEAVEAIEKPQTEPEPGRRGFWDWFFGRPKPGS